ncbi:MAG: hypothetical protein HOW73_48525 [Polyangiaceae bacterium]|nr:hypothetical protein [Polyangiaceae bacterium]
MALVVCAACEPRLLPASDATDAVLIASPSPESEVREAIIHSLNEERFQTESEEPGFIRARFERGGRMIQIAVEYSGTQYRFRYLASEGFESQGQGQDLLIDERYHKQIKKLKKQIDQRLAGPGPSAAAAVGATDAQAQPAEDTRSEGQVIVDILATQGYACVAEEARWVCTPPSDPWPMTVSYVPENGVTTIWFDSYSTRAFAKPCNRFNAATKDLAKADHSFTASCDDAIQSFRFNTAVVYGPDLDVVAWAKDHRDRRSEAHSLLVSVGAIRQ